MRLVQDLTYGARQLRAQPVFSIVAVLTLALGTGVATALFSVIDAALLRPLPYPHPEELVTVSLEFQRPDGATSRYAPSLADVRAWRESSQVLSQAGVGRVSGFSPLIVEAGATERLSVGEASEGFLETYGVVPALGRLIQVDDTREGAASVAILGHAYWQREFGGDPAVLGRTLRIRNAPATIVGVMPPGFYDDTAVWQPRQFTADFVGRRGSGTPVVARLRPGVSLPEAAAAMDGVTPSSPVAGAPPVKVLLESMYDDETSGYGRTLRMLAAAVGLILVIACVNVGGLLLARGAARQTEFAVRASLGAGRGRLVRQLLTESLLLAATGAGLGVVFAWAALDALVGLVPLSLPANAAPAINGTVLAFAVTLSCLTAIGFGLVPALRLSRARGHLTTELASGGRGGAGPLSRRAGQRLIAVEVALAVVLLAGAGLVVRSFAKLLSVDLGYDPESVLTLEVEPLEEDATVRHRYYTALTDALRAMPEVEWAGAIGQLDLTGGGSFGFPQADNGKGIEGPQRPVLPGFFEAFGVRPLVGRFLEASDVAAAEAVVVDESTARTYFDGQALGHTLTTRGRSPRTLRIVGVTPDIRHGGPQGRPDTQMYVLPAPPRAGESFRALAMVMRLREGARLDFPRVKAAAESIGPRVLVGRFRPASDLVGQTVTRPRHRMLLLGLLGAFGLGLTLVGIFSMTAYAVARRTREIGVRMAFGAQPADVVRTFVRDAVWPVAIGLVLGVGGAYYATRVIESFLYDTTPHDPATLATVVAGLGIASALAAWLPARRAARVDPVRALRAE